MPKDKKSKKDIIEILHQILDNPHDPKFKASTFEENKSLDSIRKRLSGEPLKTDGKYISSDFLPKKYDSLEPRVAIYQKEEKITPPEIKKLEPGERAEEVKEDFPEEDFFDDVDLYEVEKVDISEPEFLEVRPKETTKKQEEVSEEAEIFLPVPEPIEKEKTKDMKDADEELPEWESVDITKPEEEMEKKEGKISEFEKIDEEVELQPPSGEIEEEVPTWEPVSEERVQEEIVELPEEPKEEKPPEEGKEKISKEKEKESKITKKEREQQKIRILSFLKERKRKKKEREEQKSEELEIKGPKKLRDEIVIGGKESEENILKKLEAKADWRKVKEISGDVEKETPEWEPEEKTKLKETVEKKEGKISEIEKIDEEAELQPPSGEIEEEIPTWEPVSEERVEEEIVELSEEPKEEKPPEKDKEKISEEKEPRITEKERLAELKRQKREQIAKEREEQRSKKIEAKKALIEARKKDKEAKKAKKEKERKLREKQKEKQRLKIIEEKKALIEAREQEKESRIAEKERLTELKRQKKVRRAKEKVVSPSKSISEGEELTEWASYDVEEEIPDIDSTAEFYKHGDYTLYMKEIKTSTGKKRTIHFFSKKKPDLGEAIPLPEGYKVMINKKTKLPYLRKKK
jgi:hypothetical protein